MKRPRHIEQFYAEPNVRALICNAKNFIAFVKANINKPNGLALIQKQLDPIIIPVELQSDIADLWKVTVENLETINN